MRIAEFQRRIEEIYFERDSARGVEGCFRWLVEEVGELSRAIRHDDPKALQEEFADCLAWLSTLASLKKIDLAAAAQAKYGKGCPRCGKTPCGCG